MKSILVPTDFSACAENALTFAVEFAKHLKAKIVLLHVYHIPAYSADMPIPAEALEVMRDAAMEDMEKTKQTIQQNENLIVEIKAVAGFTGINVVEESKENDVSLIILGTQGANGLKRMILGSNAAYIATHADVPVVVVPDIARFHGINHIVLASAMEENEIQSVQEAFELLKPFTPTIEILHAFENENEDAVRSMHYKKKLQNYFPHLTIEYKEKKGEAVCVIDDEVEHHQTDLLVMFNHKRNIFQRLFNKSVTKEIVFESGVPLLVIKQSDRSGIVF